MVDDLRISTDRPYLRSMDVLDEQDVHCSITVSNLIPVKEVFPRGWCMD
jgi:hypothetical protein